MKKHDNNLNALDDDILEMLAEAHEPVEIDDETVLRMRDNLMSKIKLPQSGNEELAAKYPLPDKFKYNWTQVRKKDGTAIRP